MKLLSILIPTINKHQELFTQLTSELFKQIVDNNAFEIVEVLSDKCEVATTGKKRNNLLLKARGNYVCFIDADDMVATDYIKTVLEPLKSNKYDVLSLRGEMTTNGKNPELFEHSIVYKEWKTTDNLIKYERYPNHLNIIKRDIANKFVFPDKTFGEDHAWSKLIHESNLLRKELYLDKILYYYKYITK